MKTLHLNLKKKWFDLILSGEKTEEYRELKPSMVSLLFDYKDVTQDRDKFIHILKQDNNNASCWCSLREYKSITFSNGYTKKRPQFEIEFTGIDFRKGNENWGAEPNEKYLVLELGEIIK